ncbi:MAG: DUF3576 domain-containing protein [Alphaproteobacteria bacterium]|nr:DUF3576 domain-containing protein [Alphaproteobacteria bacterium]
MRLTKRITLSLLSCSTVLALSACAENSIKSEAKYPTGADRTSNSGNDIYEKPESIFGEGGIFGSRKKNDENNNSGIAVNSFLWRASLDTVSFMPLASADPFGGVILTDWYTPPETEGERFKINVFILSRELRSDGVRVRAFKQNFVSGKWVDAEATPETARQLEDTILTRARQLRVAQLD